MPTRQEAIDAIRESWSAQTTGVPDEWTPQNPARGQCDVSAFIFWELFGGNLVLAEVYVDGQQTEHHYWNRIDGEDIDLTREQFVDGEEIREKALMSNDFMHNRIPTMRSELRVRVDLMRESVHSRLTGGTARTDAD